MDPLGAQEEVLKLAAELGHSITVAVAYEVLDTHSGLSKISTGFLDAGA